MHASAAHNSWKRIGLPLLSVAALLVCVLIAPALSIPLAFIMPLIVCPAKISVGLWYALLMPVIPCAGLLMTGADIALCLCLLPCSYFCLLAQLMARKQKMQFNAAMLLSTAAVLLAQMLWWLRVSTLVEGNLFEGLSHLAVDTLASQPYSNSALYWLVTNGYLSLPTQFQRSPVFQLGSYFLMDPALHTQLLTSLRFTLQDNLATVIPTLIVQASIFIGLISTLEATRAFIRQNPRPLVVVLQNGKRELLSEDAILPSFQTLRLPKAFEGHVLFLAIASLALMLFEGEIVALIRTMMFAAFTMIYYLLGAATLMDLLGKNGAKRPVLYGMLAALLYFVFPTLLFLLGLADQWMGLRSGFQIHRKEEE